MDLSKIEPISSVLVERKKGRVVLESNTFNIDTFFDALTKKMAVTEKDTRLIIAGRHSILNGSTFKFNFKSFNWIVKPINPKIKENLV